MSRCRLERTFADPNAALARAKRDSIARGGTFEGDLSRGRYVLRTPLGAVEGTYAADGGTVTFVIERKPALVPCALIARVLDEFGG